MARYLVTGGCGFIGSHLADALVQRGHTVRILDDLSTGHVENAPPSAELVIGTITDPREVASAMRDIDGCFHLAAVASVQRCHQDWAGTSGVNLTGTINVFDAARLTCCPVVYASSAAVYGANPLAPLGEDAAVMPSSAYGADKLACELHARVASLIHAVPTTGFRFFNVYGPRQDPSSPYSGVISVFCDRLVSEQALRIHGDGEQVRDFVYVEDVIHHLMEAMCRPPARAGLFNLCTGRGTSNQRLARILGDLLGVEPRLEFGPARAGDVRLSVGNPIRAMEQFGFAADTPLEVGLRRTVEVREMESWM